MTATPDDWEILGLDPDADITTVRRAYRERRSLYETESLATYNLLDETERADLVARIDAAYERISGRSPEGVSGGLHAAVAAPEADVPEGPTPDADVEPGAHLRHRRLTRGVSLHHIEAVTKIGVAILERIENEEFEALPAPVFVRGHVEQFAREVDVADPAGFAQLYLAKMQGDTDSD